MKWNEGGKIRKWARVHIRCHMNSLFKLLHSVFFTLICDFLSYSGVAKFTHSPPPPPPTHTHTAYARFRVSSPCLVDVASVAAAGLFGTAAVGSPAETCVVAAVDAAVEAALPCSEINAFLNKLRQEFRCTSVHRYDLHLHVKFSQKYGEKVY